MITIGSSDVSSMSCAFSTSSVISSEPLLRRHPRRHLRGAELTFVALAECVLHFAQHRRLEIAREP